MPQEHNKIVLKETNLNSSWFTKNLFKNWPTTQCFITELPMVIPELETSWRLQGSESPQIVQAIEPPMQMTHIQKKVVKFKTKTVSPFRAIGEGFLSGLIKPYDTVSKALRGATGKATRDTEIYQLCQRYGFGLVSTGTSYLLSPEKLVEVAERESERLVTTAKHKIYELPMKLITFQVNPLDVFHQVQALHQAVQVARHEASSFRMDATDLYLAAQNYYTTTKLFNFVGSFIAGAVLGAVTKRYVSAPSEKLLGPSFGQIARVLTIPVRPILPKSMAIHFGRAVASRSPAAIIMMLSWLGTFYNTRDEFEDLVVSTKQAYPEVYNQVIAELDRKTSSSRID